MKQKVLVTGGAGFVGHGLIDYLLKKTDYDIISLDRLDPAGRLDRLHDIIKDQPDFQKRLSIVWHDLKAPISSFTAEKLQGVTQVYHLAAGSHVNRSIKHPLEFVMDNVVGTCNLLEYCRKHLKSLELFLYFSTDEVFGPAPQGVIFKENDRYNACNPYSASKAGAEELCNAYKNTYNLPVVITHTMNIYGPRQHTEKFIPNTIHKIKTGKKIQVHTDYGKKDFKSLLSSRQ